MLKNDFRSARLVGLAVVASGLAHFVAPRLIEPTTKPLFPNNTRRHVYVNGGLETVLGLGLWVRRSRRAAAVGLIGYTAYPVGARCSRIA